MIYSSIAVVEVNHTFLDVVVATLYDIACWASRIIRIVCIVGSIERIPVDLGSIVVATGPKIHKGRIGVHIDGWSNICTIIVATFAHSFAIEVLFYEIAILVDLSVIEEWWQVAVVVWTWVGCIVEG